MPTTSEKLRTPDGKDIHDSKGACLYVGQAVAHYLFGEGIVRAVVPLDKGIGFNVTVEWKAATRQKTSRQTSGRST